MHDHEFEKQVHQKMEELHLSPSDAVWDRVEGQLHKKKRKRRLLWLPIFFAGLICCGYFLQKYYGSGFKDGKLTRQITDNSPVIVPDNSGNPEKIRAAEDAAPDNGANQLRRKNAVPVAAASQHKGRLPLPPARIPANDIAVSGKKDIRSTTSGHVQLPGYQTQEPAVHNRERNHPGRSASSTEIAGGQTEVAAPFSAPHDQLPAREPLAVAVSAGLLAKEPFQINAEMAPDPKPAIRAVKLSKKHRLEWGITLRAGRTSLNDGKLNKFFASSLLNDRNLAFQNGGTLIVASPSRVKAGTGFSAGFFLQKQLSSKLALSAGINYALYTTSIVTGSRVDSAVSLSASTSAREYFRLGSTNTYTNRYHFIELPVLLHTQLNRGKKVPLVWDAGVTFSRLISSNALHYTSAVNGYSKNNGLYNRTQLNLQTGVYLQAFSGSQHAVRIGPHIQYGITPLFSDENKRRNHFLQYGFTISTVIR